MKTIEKPRICGNPACSNGLAGEKSNKIYCNYKCKYTHNNAQTRERHRREFKETEDQLRHNVAVLQKLLLHPKYQNGRIEQHYLDYEKFFLEACRFPTDEQKALYPDQDIA